MSNGFLSDNAAQGVRARQSKGASVGKARLAYEDHEVARLLAAADKEKPGSFLYWGPWLLALSGARSGEMAQLWGQRVREKGGVWVMEIRPAEDGGTLKNAVSLRDIPVHPALIERGFIKFVQSKGDGPLFYGSSTANGRGRYARPRKDDSKHASKGVTNRLSTWIRQLPDGFDNPQKDPAHALRHWVKTTLSKAKIQDSVADALQGHSATSRQGAAGVYRHVELGQLVEAVKAIPVPRLAAVGEPQGDS